MRHRAALLGLALVAVPAAAQDVAPFAAAEDTRRLDEEEHRVWYAAREFDRAVRLRGHLFGDEALDAYLQELADSLYPEFRGVLRVRAVRDPALNAFALPNGSLYIHIGLIGRMDNEAQLATVLAHECAHFVHRHGLRTQKNLKSSSAFAVGAAMLGGVGALLGNLAALSSIYGYSRELEREADARGFERLARSGYAASESTRAFEILETETRLLDVKAPFMFSSHPQLRERIQTFTELAAQAGAAGGRSEAGRFLARTAPARLAWMEAELARLEPRSLIHHLTRPGAEERYPARFRYYLGEAYRLRAAADDARLAEDAYRAALAAAPEFAPSHRALGVLHLKRGEHAAAREHFDAFLRLAPEAGEAGYVRDYLRQAERALEGNPP